MVTPRLPSSVSITKTSSKAPVNLKTASETSPNRKSQKPSKPKTSLTANPFNISTSFKNTSSLSVTSPKGEIVLSPNNPAYNRGAVEDSDEENLVIHE